MRFPEILNSKSSLSSDDGSFVNSMILVIPVNMTGLGFFHSGISGMLSSFSDSISESVGDFELSLDLGDFFN